MSTSPRLATNNSEKISSDDPFATPMLHPSDPPRFPEPVAVQRTQLNDHWPPSPQSQYEKGVYTYKSASMSSAGTTMTHISSIDLEKGGILGKEMEQVVVQKKHSSRDPEKAISPTPGSRSPSRRDRVSRDVSPERDEEQDEDDIRHMQELKAVRILMFLSGPCVLLSFLNALWTMLSLLLTAMSQPVRLCARRPSFSQQLGGLIGPSLNLQLRSIYTPLPPYADEDTSYHTGTLVIVQLLSPFVSFVMAIAAWIVAVFWLSSMVVGDPAGTDKRDDGRETVLAVRSWWEAWLVRSIKLE